jgi:hypothetical protein
MHDRSELAAAKKLFDWLTIGEIEFMESEIFELA